MKSKSVLVVDDDPMIRKLICKLLQKEGIETFEAADGIECLERCQACSPAVVLIDIIMPEKDGLAAIQEIKSGYPNVKIIAMSGGLVFTPEVYLDEAKACGADFRIAKPIDNKELFFTIQSCLDGSSDLVEPIMKGMRRLTTQTN